MLVGGIMVGVSLGFVEAQVGAGFGAVGTSVGALFVGAGAVARGVWVDVGAGVGGSGACVGTGVGGSGVGDGVVVASGAGVLAGNGVVAAPGPGVSVGTVCGVSVDSVAGATGLGNDVGPSEVAGTVATAPPGIGFWSPQASRAARITRRVHGSSFSIKVLSFRLVGRDREFRMPECTCVRGQRSTHFCQCERYPGKEGPGLNRASWFSRSSASIFWQGIRRNCDR